MKPLTNVTRLKTRPDLLKEDQAESLFQALLPFEGLVPAGALDQIKYAVRRQTKSDRKGAFIMLNASQNLAVVNYLREQSTRPLLALGLWALCFDHVYEHTGQIMLSREELAEKLGCKATEVSEIMGELVKFGAIFANRVKVAGMRGPGMVQYRMNPHVAEYGSRLSQAEINQIPLPGFELIQGGKG